MKMEFHKEKIRNKQKKKGKRSTQQQQTIAKQKPNKIHLFVLSSHVHNTTVSLTRRASKDASLNNKNAG